MLARALDRRGLAPNEERREVHHPVEDDERLPHEVPVLDPQVVADAERLRGRGGFLVGRRYLAAGGSLCPEKEFPTSVAASVLATWQEVQTQRVPTTLSPALADAREESV